MNGTSQAEGRPGEHRFSFLGSRLCLDFVNTVSGMRLVAPIERLRHYLDLVSWGEQAGVLEKAAARALRTAAKGEEAGTRRVLERAIALREALSRLEPAMFLLFCCHLILIWCAGPAIGALTGPLGAPLYPLFLLTQPLLALGATLLLGAALRKMSPPLAQWLSGGRLKD